MTPAPANPPRFSALLGSDSCWILPGARDKWVAIADLLDRLVASGKLPEERREKVHAALVERERSMSTGMEHGVALPHAGIEGLPDLVTALAVFRSGVPFQSIDGQPARIVVLLLIPKERRLAFLPVLAEAARLLAREDVRARLMSSSTAAEVCAAIAAAESSIGG
jgi:mannitol/fructose-specific phosphotransferase system IIA component (Ntr-type)